MPLQKNSIVLPQSFYVLMWIGMLAYDLDIFFTSQVIAV